MNSVEANAMQEHENMLMSEAIAVQQHRDYIVIDK